jgi:aminoglycoside phosphotransferase (APT) family kinase protein
MFLEIEWQVAGRSEHASLVVRLPPHGDGLFPTYDLVAQGAIQRIVAAAGLPAVEPLAVETDERWVGAPFLLMPRVAGRVVRADVPYLRSGWLAEAAPEEQGRLQAALTGLLASLHRLDWRALACDRALGVSVDDVAQPLRAEVRRWQTYLTWAGDGMVPAIYESAAAWCAAHVPDPEPPPSLLWGDVQLGNVLVGDDMSVAAMLDFEMASIGPAEMDLGWFRVLHRMTVARCGGDLPGFDDEAGTLAAYEQRLGRPVTDLLWY